MFFTLGLPLSLRLRAEACSLQTLVDDWGSAQSGVWSTTSASGAKCGGHHKDVTSVSLQAVARVPRRVPFFVEGTQVE